VLIINNRLAYTYRDVSILRHSGGTVVLPMLTKRQLREQTDLDNDVVYQFEPVWRFATGTIGHTLLTGAQVEWDSIDDDRATADLPNIANIYAPVIPETSVANLTFLRDATHIGMIDDLRALYLSAYAVDQVDLSDHWKLRIGIRKERWDETLRPEAFVPGRETFNGTPLEPGMTQTEIDTPLSWSIGTLYKVLPGVAPFAGVSKSYLTNFNSEATQQGSTVIDTMFGYYAPHWDSQVGIKNIANVEYFTTAESAGGYVGQPRTYYGRLAWHY
jgi:iron complex outermembrane receptor protein